VTILSAKFIFRTAVLTAVFFSALNQSHAIIKPEKTPISKQVDLSSEILNGDQMVLFMKNFENQSDPNIAKTDSGIFGANQSSVFSADKLTADKINNTITLADNVKIRTNSNFLIYANSAEINQNTNQSKITNAHLFFNNNASLVAKEIERSENGILEIKNVTLSSCLLTNCSDLESEKSRKSKEYISYQNILTPENLNTFTNNRSYSDVQNQYNSLPWSIKADKMVFDESTQDATLYNAKLRILGVPVIKVPEFYQNLDGTGSRNGILYPELVMMGKRQLGLGLPYYMRYKNRSDVIITPTIYTNISGISGAKINQTATTMDQTRMRENTVAIKARHLFYEGNEDRDEGVLKISGIVTDNTNLINPLTKIYKTENGHYVDGNRWHIDIDGEFGITKDTYGKLKYESVSDPNFMMIYGIKLDNTYARNSMEIVKANEDSYNKAEIVTFQPLLFYTQDASIPMASPHIRSVFEKKIDNIIGGRAFIDQRFVSLNREIGYDSNIYNLQSGYNLSKRTDLGIYFTSNASFMLDYQDSKKNSTQANYLSGKAFSMQQNINFINQANNQAILYPNADNVYQYSGNRMMYNGIGYNGQGYQNARNYYNLSLDTAKPFFTGFGSFGQVIVEPRISIKQSPYMNYQGMLLEDSFGSQIQTANLYSNNLSDGYGVMDSGKRVAYGVTAYSKIGQSGLNFALGGGVVNYVGAKNAFYYDYNGFGGNMSNYVGNIKLYNKNFEFEHEYRINTNHAMDLANNVYDPYFHKTSITTNIQKLQTSISYNKMPSDPFGYMGSLRTVTPSISYFFDNGVVASLMGIMVTSTSESYYSESYNTWLRKTISIVKHNGCMFYGFNYIENNYIIPGISRAPMIRFVFGLSAV
jgi:lipopolysaccharide assembly outer membrane protein LptD (OstA)